MIIQALHNKWLVQLAPLYFDECFAQAHTRHRRYQIFKFDTKTWEAFILILRLRLGNQKFSIPTWKSQFSILRLIPESLKILILRLLIGKLNFNWNSILICFIFPTHNMSLTYNFTVQCSISLSIMRLSGISLSIENCDFQVSVSVSVSKIWLSKSQSEYWNKSFQSLSIELRNMVSSVSALYVLGAVHKLRHYVLTK